MSKTKMQWLVEKYENNTLPYILHNTCELFGTCEMPTGSGKSGVIIEHCLWEIDHHTTSTSKLVINISSPILKLKQQTAKDLFNVITHLYRNDDIRDKMCVVINSSDDGKNYNDCVVPMGINILRFSDFDKFILDDRLEICIMVSCHKSLYKFIDKLSDLTSHDVELDVVNLLDESHLLDYRPHPDNDDVVYTPLDKLCDMSTKLYALSATPNVNVTKLINSYNHYGLESSQPIYKLAPNKAINLNIIVPPNVCCIRSSGKVFGVRMVRNILGDARRRQPSIFHKLLITMKESDQMIALRLKLEQAGIKVFSTCDKYGFGTSTADKSQGVKDIVDFNNKVDEYQGDCVVLHIKQLIQGIDIKSLTDCVIWCNDIRNSEAQAHLIQIIGRVLRPLDGERGIPYALRLKQFSNVYVVDENKDDVNFDEMSRFIMDYYGLDLTKFVRYYGNSKVITNDLFSKYKVTRLYNGDDKIRELVVKVDEYLKLKVVPVHRLYKRMHKRYPIMHEMENIIKHFNLEDKGISTNEIITNKKVCDEIKALFDKYSIN